MSRRARIFSSEKAPDMSHSGSIWLTLGWNLTFVEFCAHTSGKIHKDCTEARQQIDENVIRYRALIRNMNADCWKLKQLYYGNYFYLISIRNNFIVINWHWPVWTMSHKNAPLWTCSPLFVNIVYPASQRACNDVQQAGKTLCCDLDLDTIKSQSVQIIMNVQNM